MYSEGQNLYNVSNISSKSTITLDPKSYDLEILKVGSLGYDLPKHI